MYEEFVEKAKKKHGDKYDYSRSKYVGSKKKLTIICPVHGEFEQSPNCHLKGQGCPKCGKERIKNSGTNFRESFVMKAHKKHNKKYDYSKVDYKNSTTPVIIICPTHGEFEQKPVDHLRYGCISCSKDEYRNRKKQEFIKRANKKHGGRYDYSKVEYINSFVKVIIICPEHGEFEQAPHMHLKYGCRRCGHAQSGSAIACSKQEFIERANKKHGRKYDYSDVHYKNLSSVLNITCPIHGKFEQKAKNHLKYGCPKCGIDSLSLSVDEFVRKARKIHGNKYDYSKVNYRNSYTRVVITCPNHGEFEQDPHAHLNGHGCPECCKHTTDDFVKKAKLKHRGRYDYSKVNYENKKSKVIIVCPKHGEFKQSPYLHLDGSGCPQCANDSLYSNTDDFVRKAKLKHDNKYDYSKVDYVDNRSKVTIHCSIHGEFSQTPMDHLQGCGCPRCGIVVSAGHQEIVDFIKSVSDTQIKVNDRQAVYPHELDIYLPEHRFAIEYHGLYWHSFDYKESIEEKTRHRQKHEKCMNNGIKLYQIFEHEWLDDNVREILKSKINVSLGQCNKVHARKCKVKELDIDAYKEFIDKYHMQGYKTASVRLGLFNNDSLVSVMSFNKHRKYGWEITRFANELNTVVVGGASKLFKYFINNYNPNQVMTYADRRYSDGGLYKKLGFNLDGETRPNYFYVKNGAIFSRQQFQKHKLVNKLDIFDQALTESQNMFNNNYRRIWDAGHFRFLWVKDKNNRI